MTLRRVGRGVLSLARRAAGKSPAYLAWRAATFVMRRTRRYTRPYFGGPPGLTRVARALGRSPSLQLRLRNGRVPLSQDEVDGVLAALRADDPNWATRVTDRADRVLDGGMEVMAGAFTPRGEPIDWHRDYRSGLRFPPRSAIGYDLLDYDRPSDVRVVWELNRLHFLPDLAKAWRVTRDERYARGLVQVIDDWSAANPYDASVNWTCAMEAALRAVNVIWALTIVLPSQTVDDGLVSRAVQLLLAHGHFIRQNIEYSDVRHNHYLADLVGLVYIGLFLPEFDEAVRWLDWAAPRLVGEIAHQTHPDGCSHEGSIPYHGLLTELFLVATLALDRGGRSMPTAFLDRLVLMLEFVRSYTKPDGQCPVVGDNDDGRVLALGENPVHDHRHLLAAGASFFGRPDLLGSGAQDFEQAWWLTGLAATGVAEVATAATPETSRAFPDGGFFILRNGGDYVLVDCGDVGMRGRGGHGHCDILSIVACLGGEDVLVDTGCPSYSSDRSRRRSAILAASHNVPLLDGREYGRLNPAEFLSVGATPGRLRHWERRDHGAVFEGEHAAYDPTIVRRRVELGDGVLVVVDTLIGSGQHRVESRFHLAPGCTAVIDDRVCSVRTPRGALLRLVGPATGGWTVERATVYPRYGVGADTSVACWDVQVELPTTIEIRLER